MGLLGGNQYRDDRASLRWRAVPPGTMLRYYVVEVAFEGPGAVSPVDVSRRRAGAPIEAMLRSSQAQSPYTNMTVIGSVTTNLLLVRRQPLAGRGAGSSNLVNPTFQFRGYDGGVTTWGDANPGGARSARVRHGGDGRRRVPGARHQPRAIWCSGFRTRAASTACGAGRSPTFDEWAEATNGFGTYTNAQGWVLLDGRTTGRGPRKTARSGVRLRGPGPARLRCLKPMPRARRSNLRSPLLPLGLGEIALHVPESATGGSPVAGFAVQTP